MRFHWKWHSCNCDGTFRIGAELGRPGVFGDTTTGVVGWSWSLSRMEPLVIKPLKLDATRAAQETRAAADTFTFNEDAPRR